MISGEAYLTQGLHRAVQRNDPRSAVVFEGRSFTYAELTDRVARLASALRGMGVEPGDRVAMLAHNSPRYLEYYMATFWLGAVACPVNARWSAAEILYSLRDCTPKILIVDDHHLDSCRDFLGEAEMLIGRIHAGERDTPDDMLSYEDLIQRSHPVEDLRQGGSNPAAIFYTGGTTGHPKGVMLSHHNLMVGAMALRTAERPPSEVTLHVLPMFHGGGLFMFIAQLAAMEHRTHVILPRFDPDAVLEAIDRHGVTDLFMVPAMLQMIFDRPEADRYNLDSLSMIWYGGTMAGQALFERLASRLPKVGFNQLYAMTEAPTIALLPPSRHLPDRWKDPQIRSTGRPTGMCEVRIVDEEGKTLPANSMGEILIRGANVMLGYWNKPEETAAALRDGWLHTGDMGKVDEQGYVYILDRLKDMIRTGAENVFAAEVENALGKHPAVAASAVIGIPDQRMGEAIHAVIILKPGAEEPSLDALREHCRASLAGYKLPKSAEFRTELPMSGVGKILKRDLRAPFWADGAVKVGA